MLLAAAGCVTSPPIIADKAPCSGLLPDEWRQPVAGAPAPERVDPPGDALAQLKAWIGFGAAQTGQLAKANGRTTDAIGIVERCEARDREAVSRTARRKLLGVF